MIGYRSPPIDPIALSVWLSSLLPWVLFLAVLLIWHG